LRKFISIVSITLLSLFLTGCELNEIFGPSKKEIELKQRELALKEQEIKFNQSLKQKDQDASLALKEKETNAKIENDKAVIQTKKEVELAKIKSTVEKEKIQIEKHKIDLQNKEKDLKYDLKKQESTNSLSTKKYLIVFGSVLTLILLLVLFVYYNNRRKDKLRAYEDNLDKYFREKENQAKIEIATKILDTISSGKLSAEQENRLISTLSSDSKTSQTALLHEKTPSNEIPKVEVIHDIDDESVIAESSSK
jgi:cbb3-type cytochrome oxidase subunit 3